METMRYNTYSARGNMNYRTLGKTGYTVSEIGYGSWSLGSDWGTVTDDDALRVLASLPAEGINFIDTADIYGDGRSERLIAQHRQITGHHAIIATKIGRRLSPHAAEGYTEKNIRTFVERSLQNLKTSCIDLLQLHTPPSQVYYMPDVFMYLDRLVKHGKIRHYGVSVEKVEEGLKAIEYPGVATIQIIFNIVRQRPMEHLLNEAHRRNVGVIVRVPLASGLLTGKYNIFSRFPRNDHRSFNRHGEIFDRGETFAGVNFLSGLRIVKALRGVKPPSYTMAQFALRWILMHPAVSTVIVGGKTPAQVHENAQASGMPRLTKRTMQQVSALYAKFVKPQVHDRW